MLPDQDERTTTITGFVAACLERRGPPQRPLPIVLLLGRRGTGKTVLLDRLDETLTELRPRARLDLGYYSAEPDPVAILAGLMSQLHPGVKYVGSIPFPRFGLGLLALDLNPAYPPGERRRQLDALLEGRGNVSLDARLGQVLNDLTGNLPPGQRAGVVIAEWVAAWLISFVKHRRIGKLKDWYAGRDPATGGAAQDTLCMLCEWRAGEETAWRTEKTLCAAFLADLRAYFDEPHLRRPWGPITNCLVLLDNTGGPEGTRFLETLAECRAEVPGTGDPLVIVAGHHTRPGYELRVGAPVDANPRVGPPADATSPRLDHRHWLETAIQSPDPPLWYPVRLSDLDANAMQRMVPSRVLDGKHGHDADFIHALTGGHPFMTATLAAALVSPDRGPGDGDLGDLLKEHDRLLRCLLPAGTDDTILDAMAVCTATPGLRLTACNAVFNALGWHAVTAEDVRSQLTATMWADEPDEQDGDGDHLILHPLPRRLLLRRLADDTTRGEDDTTHWEQVHRYFQAYYGSRDETAVWYHKLACEKPGASGELDHLTDRMDTGDDTGLDERPALEWCRELDRITAAPNMLGTTEDQGDVVTALAGPAPVKGLERRRTVARIIVAQWLYQDRLFDPRHKLAGLLAREYQNLADCVSPHGDVFGRKAAQFGKIARGWGWIP